MNAVNSSLCELLYIAGNKHLLDAIVNSIEESIKIDDEDDNDNE